MGLINTQEPQCSNKKMEIEAGWDRAEQASWTRGGGEGARIDVVNFSVIVSRKEIQALSFALFLISRTVSQDPFQVKKGVWYRAEQERWTLGEGGGGGSIWPLDQGGPGAVDLSLVWGIKICQLQHHFQRLCSLKQQRYVSLKVWIRLALKAFKSYEL